MLLRQKKQPNVMTPKPCSVWSEIWMGQGSNSTAPIKDKNGKVLLTHKEQNVLSGRPLFWSVQSYRRIYIYTTHLCAASVERRASSDIVSMPTGSVSQSVSRRSAVNSSSRRRVRSRARRWSIVALVNKWLTLTMGFFIVHLGYLPRAPRPRST